MSDLKMPRLNTIVIAGRLTREPELVDVGDTKLCKIGIAAPNRKKVNGEWTDEAYFFEVQVWRDAAVNAAKLAKGTAVIIEGRLEQWSAKPQDGDDKPKRHTRINAFRITDIEWRDNVETKTESHATKKADGYAPQDDIPF